MRRLLVNTSWTALGGAAGQLLQFGAGLVLARLLAPSDFGLLAIVYVITGLTVIVFDLGLQGALVYEPNPEPEDLNTAFWLNAIGGVVFVLCLIGLGFPIAATFGDDRLIYLTPLAGLPFLFMIGMVHSALLTREMRFKTLVSVEFSASVVANAVTVGAAILDPGPFALVVGPALGSLVACALIWRLHPWRPTGFIRIRSARKLWKFSGGALAAALAWYVGVNSDNFLIGRFLGTTPLGYYNRAYNLMDMPMSRTGSVVGRVLFPALAALGDDRARVASSYRRVVQVVGLMSLPMLVGLAAAAPGVIPLLWGPRWGQAVFLTQALCLAGIPLLFVQTTGWLFQSQGRTRLMSKVSGAVTAAKLVAILLGLQFGVRGVAVGVAVSGLLCLPAVMRVAGSVVGVSPWLLLKDNAPTLAVTLAMGGAVWEVPAWTGHARTAPDTVALQVVVGVVLYGLGMLAWRRTLLVDLLHAARAPQPPAAQPDPVPTVVG